MSHNEEYIATLPSAYGRSILTVPWVELGGKCVINCPQTGYSAHTEFHCKVYLSQLMHSNNLNYCLQPLYGGRRHRVTTDIRRVGEKKPILKLEGEWNGVLYTKRANKVCLIFLFGTHHTLQHYRHMKYLWTPQNYLWSRRRSRNWRHKNQMNLGGQ